MWRNEKLRYLFYDYNKKKGSTTKKPVVESVINKAKQNRRTKIHSIKDEEKHTKLKFKLRRRDPGKLSQNVIWKMRDTCRYVTCTPKKCSFSDKA